MKKYFALFILLLLFIFTIDRFGGLIINNPYVRHIIMLLLGIIITTICTRKFGLNYKLITSIILPCIIVIIAFQFLLSAEIKRGLVTPPTTSFFVGSVLVFILTSTMKSKFYALFWTALLINIALTRLGGAPFGHDIKFVVCMLFGIAITYFSIHKFGSGRKILLSILLPGLILLIIALILKGWQFTDFFMISSYAYVLGFLIGWFIAKTSKLKATLSLIAVLFFNVWMYLVAYPNLLHYHNHGTFTGVANYSIQQNDTLFVNNTDSLNFSNDTGVYYLLDFWTTSCVYCFEEFPIFQQLYDEYSANDSIFITSVNVLHKGQNFDDNEKLIRTKNYTFPVYFYNGTDSLLNSQYHVKAYPTVLIIKNNKIIHKGNLNTAISKLKEFTH